MTLTQLRYVVAVDTHRHFSEAARQCHVSQPTLSTQIRKLEDELGVQLFDRSRQPVLPTNRGQRFIEQARVVLRESRRIQDVVQEEDAVTGTLRLGILPTLAPYLLPLVTTPFADTYPDASIAVQEMTTEAILKQLAADRLDAGLIATDEQAPDLVTRPLFSEPFVGYVNSSHPLAEPPEIDPRKIDPAAMWLLSEGHCFRDQVLNLCGQIKEADRPITFESGTLETLRMMVDRVGGLTLLPHLATCYMSEDERTQVRPLSSPAPQRTVRVVHPRAPQKRPLIEAYAETVRHVVQPKLMETG